MEQWHIVRKVARHDCKHISLGHIHNTSSSSQLTNEPNKLECYITLGLKGLAGTLSYEENEVLWIRPLFLTLGFVEFSVKMLPGFTTAFWLSAGAITALGVALAIPVHSAKRNDNMTGMSKDSIRFALGDKKTLLLCILKNWLCPRSTMVEYLTHILR